jgi:LemA protein
MSNHENFIDTQERPSYTPALKSYAWTIQFAFKEDLMKRSLMLGMIAVAIMMLFTGCGYNTIQQNEEAVKAAWGDVEATYQRRNDLIPNLVETVKAYAKHERETFQAVTEARAKVGTVQLSKDMIGNPQAMAQFQQAQSSMSGALSRLLLVAERYPDLKANQNFLDLQNQLEGTENRINVARTRYNQAVQTFNTSIRIFPNNLTNSLLLKLQPKEVYKADPGADKAPGVKF